MFIVGLTGGIGSGKTSVSNFFRELGVPILDTDISARSLVSQGTPAFEKILGHFGQNILNESGELNREKIKMIIFNNPSEKIWLENLLHPLIQDDINQEIKKINPFENPYIIIVIPLLIEGGESLIKAYQLDRILLIGTTPEIQIKRTQERDKISLELSQKIRSSQIDFNEALPKANEVIYNNGDLNKLKEEVKKIHEYYLSLSSALNKK